MFFKRRSKDGFTKENKLAERDGLIFEKYSSEPFNGKTKSVDRDIKHNDWNAKVFDENLTTICHYTNGRLSLYECFFDNGQLHKIITYNEKTLHGPCAVFNRAGYPIEKGNYVNGKQDGVWEKYQNMLETSLVDLNVPTKLSEKKVYLSGVEKSSQHYSISSK